MDGYIIWTNLKSVKKQGHKKIAEYQRFNLSCFKLVEVGKVVKGQFHFPMQYLYIPEYQALYRLIGTNGFLTIWRENQENTKP